MAGLAGLLGGCGDANRAGEKSPLAGRVGHACTVQFRRGDAFGAGGRLPVSPTTDAVNGAAVSVSGTLRPGAGEWIEVESGDATYCIPRASVLLVQFKTDRGEAKDGTHH